MTVDNRLRRKILFRLRFERIDAGLYDHISEYQLIQSFQKFSEKYDIAIEELHVETDVLAKQPCYLQVRGSHEAIRKLFEYMLEGDIALYISVMN